MDPRFESKIEELRRRVLTQEGTLDPAVRQAAFAGTDVPDEVAAYVDTVRRHAYLVTDAEVTELEAAGWTDDQLFELTIAAALGAAMERLRAGQRAMQEGGDRATDQAGARS